MEPGELYDVLERIRQEGKSLTAGPANPGWGDEKTIVYHALLSGLPQLLTRDELIAYHEHVVELYESGEAGNDEARKKREEKNESGEAGSDEARKKREEKKTRVLAVLKEKSSDGAYRELEQLIGNIL